MIPVMLTVKEKTVYVHIYEILKTGILVITNSYGNTVFYKKIANSHYVIISLEQPIGKYWIEIDSDKVKTKKSFHLK